MRLKRNFERIRKDEQNTIAREQPDEGERSGFEDEEQSNTRKGKLSGWLKDQENLGVELGKSQYQGI